MTILEWVGVFYLTVIASRILLRIGRKPKPDAGDLVREKIKELVDLLEKTAVDYVRPDNDIRLGGQPVSVDWRLGANFALSKVAVILRAGIE